jgi:hypothetical protein
MPFFGKTHQLEREARHAEYRKKDCPSSVPMDGMSQLDRYPTIGFWSSKIHDCT